ncbi:MAG: UDP-N-acetylmuramate--L-alanine ligase, partial [Oscillospiraceae bacterium]|nr:UDP-N-acetylmuramate--L-alanine ligase [Oscillospiraceae bacterium]
DAVVRTAAARDDNPEVMAAREQGKPVFERAEAWGHIMRQYQNAICIAGTHGKTTTTSMATHILLAAGVDPTVMIGGTLPKLQAGHRVGGGDTIVLESCEYYDSFHNFFPTVAVVLNVEADHLDYFTDLAAVQTSFRTFANLVPEDGCIVANGDDQNTMDALLPLGRPLLTCGFGAGNRVRAENIAYQDTHTVFDVLFDGALYTRIDLPLPGAHNVANALAAIAAAIFLGLPPEAAREGLADFTGAGRRFEYKGEVNGAKVYDDYAHHPSELRALLDAVEPLGFGRVIVAFQPHTYTRTKALFDDFVRELRRPDLVLVGEIYAAREQNTVGITAAQLAAEIPGALHFATLSAMTEALGEIAGPGDIILTVGAGDIFKVGEGLLHV